MYYHFFKSTSISAISSSSRSGFSSIKSMTLITNDSEPPRKSLVSAILSLVIYESKIPVFSFRQVLHFLCLSSVMSCILASIFHCFFLLSLYKKRTYFPICHQRIVILFPISSPTSSSINSMASLIMPSQCTFLIPPFWAFAFNRSAQSVMPLWLSAILRLN